MSLADRALANRDRAREREIAERERIRQQYPGWIAFLADCRAVFGPVTLLRLRERDGYEWGEPDKSNWVQASPAFVWQKVKRA